MIDHAKIQIDLINQATGGWLLRVSEATSGLALEKKVDPIKPVVRQKENLLKIFEATLERAELATA